MERNYQIKSVPRKFELIANQIVDFIKTENYKAGDKLPTERKLSELLQVSRSSIREGIRVLELLKIIESRQGEGTFVSNSPSFIIPYQILDQGMNEGKLHHYYEIGVLVAEKITTLAINSSIEISFDKGKVSNDWNSFSSLILSLANELENTYYYDLWSNIYSILYKNAYFNKKEAVPIDIFLDGIYNRDKTTLTHFFRDLENIN